MSEINQGDGVIIVDMDGHETNPDPSALIEMERLNGAENRNANKPNDNERENDNTDNGENTPFLPQNGNLNAELAEKYRKLIDKPYKKISKKLKEKEDGNFWDDEKVNYVMNHYATATSDVDNIMKLFSILMHDWYDQDEDSEKKYFLNKKLTLAKNKLNFGIFDKLFGVFDDHPGLSHYCLHIIYKFLYDEADTNPDNDDLKALYEKALEIKNVEYGLNVLKILVALLNAKSLTYSDVRDSIIKKVTFHLTITCQTPYTSLVRHADFQFFKLAFMLKESKVMSFKVHFLRYVELNKKLFGDYWATAIRFNAQFLHLMAEVQGLFEIKEHLLIILKDPQIKFPITSYFKRVADFYNFSEDTCGKEELLKRVQQKDFKNSLSNRKSFFNRKDHESRSTFEEFFMEPLLVQNTDNEFEDMEKTLNLIWGKLRLWNMPEILTVKNCLQKRLIDYVLETKSDSFIVSFLQMKTDIDTSKTEKSSKIHNQTLYMVLKNALYCDFYDTKTNGSEQKGLIEYHLNMIGEAGMQENNLGNIFYFFEERDQYDIRDSSSDYFIKVFNENSGTDKSKLLERHFVLGLMMIYWNYLLEESDVNQQIFEPRHPEHEGTEINTIAAVLDFSKQFPFLEALLTILQEKNISSSCLQTKMMKMLRISQAGENEQEEELDPEKYSANLSFVLLFAAMKTNQEDVVKQIFKLNNFLICKPFFPINIIPEEIHHKVALLFLENRYELGRNDLPPDWITHDVFEEFLDSRVTRQKSFYKIDCSFMLPFYNYDKPINSVKDVDDDLIFNEDYDTIEYIAHSHELKSLLSHPVMEMITRIKIKKYNHILMWNLFIFLLAYLVPTLFLMLKHNYNLNKSNITDDTSNYSKAYKFNCDPDNKCDVQIDEQAFNQSNDGEEFSNILLTNKVIGKIMFGLLWIGLLYVIIRETFQFTFMYKKKLKNYLKDVTNVVELMMVASTICFLTFILINENYKFNHSEDILLGLEIINIVLLIIVTAFALPVLKLKIYMRCLGQVFITYLNIFIIFLPLFFGCVTLAHILFNKKFGGKIEAFQSIGTALMKYIIMFSGEIGLEPENIEGVIQVVGLTLIIILLVNKGNLLLSMTINDVNEEIAKTKTKSLQMNAKKYITFAKSIRIFYALNVDILNTSANDQQADSQNQQKSDPQNDAFSCNIKTYLIKAFYKVIVRLLKNDSYVHRMQCIYVDHVNQGVYADINKEVNAFDKLKTQCICQSSRFAIKRNFSNWLSNLTGRFFVDDELMSRIQAIVSKSKKCKCEEKEKAF